MIRSYGELDDSQIDVLRELGNIGAGNAATSLSAMINEGVRITVPEVKILDYEKAVTEIGEPEDLGIAVMLQYSGDVRGIILFMLGKDDAKNIGEVLMGSIPDADDLDGSQMSDLKLSMIQEFGNILGCSYLNSIAMMTGLQFEISVPYISIDMVGAILSTPLLLFSIDNSKILLIEEVFLTEPHSLTSHVILFADIPSLNTIFNRLGLNV